MVHNVGEDSQVHVFSLPVLHGSGGSVCAIKTLKKVRKMKNEKILTGFFGQYLFIN